MQIDSAVKARRGGCQNRSQRSASPKLAGFVSAQSTESASLQRLNQVHKNKQKPDPASTRQNMAIEGTS